MNLATYSKSLLFSQAMNRGRREFQNFEIADWSSLKQMLTKYHSDLVNNPSMDSHGIP